MYQERMGRTASQSFAACAAWLLKNCPPGTEHCREIWTHDIFLFVIYIIYLHPIHSHCIPTLLGWYNVYICTLYEHIYVHILGYIMLHIDISHCIPIMVGRSKNHHLVGRISISCRDRNGKPAESSTTTAVALIRAERRIRCGDMS